jgi:hypothetical protein
LEVADPIKKLQKPSSSMLGFFCGLIISWHCFQVGIGKVLQERGVPHLNYTFNRNQSDRFKKNKILDVLG